MEQVSQTVMDTADEMKTDKEKVDVMNHLIAELEYELASAQAREKVLVKIIEDTKDEVWMCLSHEHATRFSAALRLPQSDDTALHNLIVYERLDAVRNYQTMYENLMLPDLLKAERERCITAVKAADDCGCVVPCDCFSVGSAIYAIRALEDE